jgi:hypothetical protein
LVAARAAYAERFDASGDLADLLLAVPPRVRRVGFEFFDSTMRNDQT